MASSNNSQNDKNAPAKKSWLQEHGWFWLGVFGLGIGALIELGRIVNNPWSDYSHEIASAFLGVLVTIPITAALLRAQEKSSATLQNAQAKAQSESAEKLQKELIQAQSISAKELLVAQSKAEKERENNAIFFEKKVEIYGELLKSIEEFLQNNNIKDSDKEFTKLTLICIHVTYVANSRVLEKLNDFTSALLEIIREDSEEIDRGEEHYEGHDPITHAERKTALSEFGKVATAIKTDLVKSRKSFKDESNEPDSTQTEFDNDTEKEEEPRLHAIQNIIDNLSLCGIAYVEAEKRLKRRKEDALQNISRPASLSNSPSTPEIPVLMNKATFLEACSKEGEEKFYKDLFQGLDDAKPKYHCLWTQRGFSLERTVKFYPQNAGGNFANENVINRPAQEKLRANVETKLHDVLNCSPIFGHQNIKFEWSDIKDPDPKKWLEIIELILR